MKNNDLSVYKIKKNYIKPLTKTSNNKKIIGFDTETYEGKVSIISDSNRNIKIIYNLKELMDYLTTRKYNESVNFFFNLEYDTNAIIKFLPKTNLMDLVLVNNTKLVLKGKIYKLTIIPRKALIIRYGKHSYKFFDIFQFYQIGNLEKTYKKVLTPITGKKFKKSLNAEGGYALENIDNDVIDYCYHDALACQELAEHFVKACRQIIPINNFFSPASLAKLVVRKYLKLPYKLRKNKLQAIALKSYNGGRFECIKRGGFDKLHMYDINSAYPYAISQIPDMEGILVYNRDYIPEATHGFFTINIYLEDFYISPLRYMLKKPTNLLIYPIGYFEEITVTKFEMELIHKYNLKYELIESVQILNQKPTYPFEYVKNLYETRLKYKKSGNPLNLPLKLALNSMYGIMIQTTEIKSMETNFEYEKLNNNDNELLDICPNCDSLLIDLIKCECLNCGIKFNNPDVCLLEKNLVCGNFFNAVYASEITSHIRCKLFEDSMKAEKHIVSYATDGILTTEKIKLPFSDKLGDYEKDENLSGLIVGSGIYSLHGEGLKKPKTGFRGFSKTNILNYLKGNELNASIELVRKGVIKFKESKYNDFENLNQFVDKKKVLSVNFDRKRRWDWKPKNFKELQENIIDSKPIIL